MITSQILYIPLTYDYKGKRKEDKGETLTENKQVLHVLPIVMSYTVYKCMHIRVTWLKIVFRAVCAWGYRPWARSRRVGNTAWYVAYFIGSKAIEHLQTLIHSNWTYERIHPSIKTLLTNCYIIIEKNNNLDTEKMP